MPEAKAKLKMAVVCHSNMNRSMEAHLVLSKKNLNIASYGTGAKIKIPGLKKSEPNIYAFGTTYQEIYDDLVAKDKRMYTENGLLHIMDRNRRIKEKPEKFQECKEQFELILTCEEKVYDACIAHFEETSEQNGAKAHIINMDVVDNLEDATIGAFLLCELAVQLDNADDLDDDIEEILHEFEAKCSRSLLHTVCFY